MKMNLDWICIDSKVMHGAQEAVKVVLMVSMVMNLLELMDSSTTFVWMANAAGDRGGPGTLPRSMVFPETPLPLAYNSCLLSLLPSALAWESECLRVLVALS